MLNLAVKYRPLIFDDVVGQNKITNEFLKRSKENNLSQVIYLNGSTGTGKTTIIYILAKSMLCQEKDKDGNPCNKCDSCVAINENKKSLNVFEFNCSNLNIEETRQIEELASIKSFSLSGKKVIILDELQELFSNAKARKNLLKVLEKPNEKTYFILAAMEDKVDKALKDRCIQYYLKPIEINDISNYLMLVAEKEGININDDIKINILLEIAANSNGSLREALGYLERAIYSELWTKDELFKELNILSTESIFELMNGILLGDFNVQLNNINKDVVNKMRYYLGLYLKVLLNKENASTYEKGILKNFKIATINILFNTISKLNVINDKYYVDKSFIDFIILDIINSNQTLEYNKEKNSLKRRGII